MRANSLPQVADGLSAVMGGEGEGRRKVSRSSGERVGMSASSSEEPRMTVIWSVSAALANHGGVGEPNRLAVSLPAATVSEVN